MALSLRHQAFIDEYLKDRNGTQAAIRAGYSPKGAHVAAIRVLRNATVQEAIVARTQTVSAITNVTVAGVLEKLQAIYDGATTDHDWSAAAKAAQLIGQHLAMFTENHRVTVEPSEREARLAALFARN